MKRYIDFDGVILDTSPLLFKKWRENNQLGLTEQDKIAYVQRQDWPFILHNSPVINDSLYYLRQLDKNKNAILTVIHSLEEGAAKIKFIRENNIEIPIITVPYLVDKASVVAAKDNILIDDRIYNLNIWEEDGGYAIFFNQNDLNYDEWHQENTKYPKIKSLNNIEKIKVRNRG